MDWDKENEKSKFHDDMIDIYRKCKTIGYTPTRFYNMVTDVGGYEAARQLIAKEDGSSSGFAELFLRHKLEWSMEALVVEQWARLFTADEVKVCEKRLAQVGYKLK